VALDGHGPEIHERACAMGLEGIISKQQDAPYRAGRVESWIKVKCGKRDAFPIVAFVEKLGAKPRKIASFYIGRRDGDRLLYAGKVRGGFTEAEARDLRERLDPLIRKDAPLSERVKKPKATWVEPVIEAEVAYSTMTEHQLLREAVFKGLHGDRQSPPAPTPGRRPSRAESRRPQTGVRGRTFCSSCRRRAAFEGGTRRMGEGLRAGPYLGRRPLKLVRHVRGTTFYWEFVIETALRLRRMLKAEGLEPWPKLTGGRGLHLMAPLDRAMDHDQARAYQAT
jgi:bifunctional non-homologous end joining protein LigD